MKTVARRRSLVPVALAAALLTGFLLLIAPLSASAHDSLIASSPEADSAVETLPAALTLTFSAKLIDGDGATEVVVTDASGASVTDGAASVDGAIVTQPLVAEAAAGGYHVIWKIVSSDGHPTSGEFDFTVANSTVTAPAPGPSATPEETPTAEATAAPAATPTPQPSESAEDGSSATTWIWLLAIAGVLAAAVAGVIAVALKGRARDAETAVADPSDPDSDAPMER
ncbi:copper resistance CopC family protein [Microbacterium hydrocarbonoxydans]|uniref:copper resistance CopC family protein n=1 Tax=Microbacterium hydrocarbonoxydans TaxID=273678 RepID=UPI00203E96DC|nr:copper resistance CopC family protein [Microbacterium hydrocarbonoxydans]MCM3781067.1 copper resistance protein CopC [Microbacterium hydrocarbonoxydans]